MFLKGEGNCFYDKYLQRDFTYPLHYNRIYPNIDYRSAGFRIVLVDVVRCFM